MTTVLSRGFTVAFLAGAAVFGFRAVLDLETALPSSAVLDLEVFRFTGTTLSGSYHNNGYRG